MFNQAFTQFLNQYNLDAGEIEKFVARGTGIGKILRKALVKRSEFYYYCTPKADVKALDVKALDRAVHRGVVWFRAEEYATQIKFLTTSFGIGEAYNDSSVRSCMTGEGAVCGPFYAANGWALAVLRGEGNRLLGRCLVDMQRKKYCGTYGSSSVELEAGLIVLGYTEGCLMDDSQEVWLPLVENYVYIPYVDWTSSFWFFTLRGEPELKCGQPMVKAVGGFAYDEEDQDLDEIANKVSLLQDRDDLTGNGYQHEMEVESSYESSPGEWETIYRLIPAKVRGLKEFMVCEDE